MKQARINTLNTAYYTGGTGQRDVLLLHGWASSGRMWLRSMWALRNGYRLWAPDLPGFGDSETPHIDWYSVERYTDHVATFCETIGIRPYAAIGHSMGGRITFDLARRYPHLVERLVAVSPTITGKLGMNLDVFMLGAAGKALKQVSRHFWPLATASAMSQYWAPRYLGSEAVQRTTSDLRRSSWEAAVYSLRAMVKDDYSQHLHEVQHPTLLICGKKDYTIPHQDSLLAERYLPNSHLMLLDHIHHQPTDECPDTYLGAVQSFLAAPHPGSNGQAGAYQ
jgi:pimeloyl-ACP methyl ester carboxylesterase